MIQGRKFMFKKGDTVYLKGTVMSVYPEEDFPIKVMFQDAPMPFVDYFHPCVLKKSAYGEDVIAMKDAAITIAVMEPSERNEIFGFEEIHDILLHFELDELNKRLEEHQVKKIHEMLLEGLSDIKIGDIVVMKDNCNEYAGKKFIVFDIVAPEGADKSEKLKRMTMLDLMGADGKRLYACPGFVEKTKDNVNMDKVFGLLRK